MRRVISVAGLAVSIEADDTARWNVLDALFGLCPTAAVSEGVIRLCFSASPPTAPDRPPDVAFSDVELWYADAGVVTRHRDGIVVVRDGDEIRAGGSAAGGGAAKAFRRAVQHVLADAMAVHGRFALHGAVVVDGAGAVIVLGDTGAGKSTLAVSALRLGWSVVTDDIAWVAATDDGPLTISGFPKPLHAPPEILDGLPVEADRVVDDPRERFVLRTGLSADDVAHPIHGIVIVRHGAAAATLVPFPTGPRLLTMVMRSFPLQGSPIRVRQFFPFAARLSHTPAVLLEHAKDPTVRGMEAAALLRDAAAAFGAPDQ
jgi:hypothetical protein